MPTYEYFCPACGLSYTKLVPLDERDKVSCPKCQNEKVKRLLSTFAVKNSSSSPKEVNPCSSCDSGGAFG